jgi:hypothetical protein
MRCVCERASPTGSLPISVRTFVWHESERVYRTILKQCPAKCKQLTKPKEGSSERNHDAPYSCIQTFQTNTTFGEAWVIPSRRFRKTLKRPAVPRDTVYKRIKDMKRPASPRDLTVSRGLFRMICLLHQVVVASPVFLSRITSLTELSTSTPEADRARLSSSSGI